VDAHRTVGENPHEAFAARQLLDTVVVLRFSKLEEERSSPAVVVDFHPMDRDDLIRVSERVAGTGPDTRSGETALGGG